MELSCSTSPDKFVAIWLKTLVLRTPPKQHQTDPYRNRHGPPACHDSPAASQPAIFTPFTPADPVRIIVHACTPLTFRGRALWRSCSRPSALASASHPPCGRYGHGVVRVNCRQAFSVPRLAQCLKTQEGD